MSNVIELSEYRNFSIEKNHDQNIDLNLNK